MLRDANLCPFHSSKHESKIMGIKNKSCQSNLILFFDQVTSLIDRGNAVDVVYLDFSVAFDKVPRDLLISRETRCGLATSSVRWINNWLQN